jgi:hypothetical protein
MIPFLITSPDFSPSQVSFGVIHSNKFSSSSSQKSIECLSTSAPDLGASLGMTISYFPSNCALGWLNADAVKTGSDFGSREFGCIACKPGFRANRKSGDEFFLIGNQSNAN